MKKYDKIHEYLLKKSENISSINSLIKANGVLVIEKEEISTSENSDGKIIAKAQVSLVRN